MAELARVSAIRREASAGIAERVSSVLEASMPGARFLISLDYQDDETVSVWTGGRSDPLPTGLTLQDSYSLPIQEKRPCPSIE